MNKNLTVNKNSEHRTRQAALALLLVPAAMAQLQTGKINFAALFSN